MDVASSLLAEALGRSCISPAKSAAAPKATGMAPAEVAQDDDYFPLTSRRGHDLNEDNWAERSKRIAALKQKNKTLTELCVCPITHEPMVDPVRLLCTLLATTLYFARL